MIRKRLFFVGFFILALALSGTQSLAANAPPFVGINYGPYHYAGQSPDRGTHIPDSQFLADLDRISQKFRYIRTYSVDKTSGLAELVPLIASNINNNHPNFQNLRVYIGVYESSQYRQETEAQLNTAIALANAYPNIVQGVVVGNEWSDRDFAPGPVTVAQIIADLQYVRGKITNPNIFVTTCLGFYAALNPQKDQWGRTDPRYQAGKDYGVQVAPYCDVMMFTAYPFYAGYDISIAYSNTKYWYDFAVNLFPGKQVFFGELGWPSAGPNQPLQLQGPPVPPNPAVTSVANEKTYITQLLNNQQNSDKLGPIFLFEAFDEPWKGGANPLQEPYWGLWTKDNAPKFDFTVPTLAVSGTPPIQAKMDINPFAPNFINTNARVFDLVPVAVLATKDFDPQTLDINTVRFGALGTEAPVMHSFVSYANLDRKRDLMLYFRISETGIQAGDDSAYLTARDKSGNLVVGEDNIRTFGSNFLPLRKLK